MKVRIVTYNIHKCIGGVDRRYRPERVGDTIAHHEPDLVLLQEVDNGARRSKGHRQVDLLGEMLGLRHRVYVPNVVVRGGGEYGNAILSRFPLSSSTNVDLSLLNRKPRSVLHAHFRVRLGTRTRTLHVFNLHLGLLGQDRKRQLRRFLSCHPFVYLHKRTPLIVGGDFNDVWGTLGEKLLHPAGFRGHTPPIRTFPAYAPLRALDSVYVRGDVKLAGLRRSRLGLARQASDHLPLVADLEIGAL